MQLQIVAHKLSGEVRPADNSSAPPAADILSKRLSRGAFFFFAPKKRGERLNNVKLIFVPYSDKTRKMLNNVK
jgi:hypothetical protein